MALSDITGAVVEIKAVAYDHPDAQLLITGVQGEYIARYGGPDDTPMESVAFAPPTGMFFVAYLDGVPTASGAWRFRAEIGELPGQRPSEIKRMYVRPDARGLGLGRQMLAHLETTARLAGADWMVLETGNKQPEAIALYESCGYAPIPAFGHYKCAPEVENFGKPLG